MLVGQIAEALISAAPALGAVAGKCYDERAGHQVQLSFTTWAGVGGAFIARLEGGAIDPSGDSFNFGPRLSSIKPKWGWEGATGFDWMPGWGPWHVSGQVRYGSAQKTQAFNNLHTFEHIILRSERPA
jgi:hypothetical protein